MFTARPRALGGSPEAAQLSGQVVDGVPDGSLENGASGSGDLLDIKFIISVVLLAIIIWNENE